MNSLKCPKSKLLSHCHTKLQSPRFMGNPCFSVSGLQKLFHSAVYDPASVYQLSTAAPSAQSVRLYVRVRRLKPIQARRTHTRTHAHRTRTHTRTHTHHRSLASRSAPCLEPRSWCVCVCVLCDRNVVLFLDKPLSGALERPRG
jgi:hypothetical protein